MILIMIQPPIVPKIIEAMMRMMGLGLVGEGYSNDEPLPKTWRM